MFSLMRLFHDFRDRPHLFFRVALYLLYSFKLLILIVSYASLYLICYRLDYEFRIID